MIQILLLIHMLVALAIIALVLLQQGKGASIGAAFGSGSSNTIFGSRGPASFLVKLTGTLAFLFFATSLSLGYIIRTESLANNQLMAPPTVKTQPHQQSSQTSQSAPTASKGITAPTGTHSSK